MTPSIERSRVCAFETEHEFAIASFASEPLVIAIIGGDTPIDVPPVLPVLFVPEKTRQRIAGSASWDSFVEAVHFTLHSIPPWSWKNTAIHERMITFGLDIEVVTPAAVDDAPEHATPPVSAVSAR